MQHSTTAAAGRTHQGPASRTKSALLYSGSLWQLLRFLLVVCVTLLAIYPESNPRFVLLYIWPLASELPLAAGFFFLARSPGRYGSYRRLLILGKLLDALPGLVLLFFQAAALFLGSGRALFEVVPALDLITGSPGVSALVFHYALFATVLFDLLFLLVLISYRLNQEATEPQITPELPELSELSLEDESW